jgi:hypothetical protein
MADSLGLTRIAPRLVLGNTGVFVNSLNTYKPFSHINPEQGITGKASLTAAIFPGNRLNQL